MRLLLLLTALLPAVASAQATVTTFPLPAHPASLGWSSNRVAFAGSRGSLLVAGGRSGGSTVPQCGPIFGGCGQGIHTPPTDDPDIHEWNGSTLGTLPRSPALGRTLDIAWDSQRQVVVTVAEMGATIDILEWDGAAWTIVAPVGATFGTLAYDTVHRRTLVVTDLGLFSWDGQAVLMLASPSWTVATEATFHELEGRLYCRNGLTTLLTFDGSSVSTVPTPLFIPPVRLGYDASNGVVVFAVVNQLHEMTPSGLRHLATLPVTTQFSDGAVTRHPATGALMIWGGRVDQPIAIFCGGPFGGVLCPGNGTLHPDQGLVIQRTGAGQPNTAAAGLFLDGSVGTGSGGPYAVSLASGRSYALDWRGPPTMPCFLFAGPPNPAGLVVPCPGSVDIGLSPVLADLVLVGDGTQDPAFRLDANGEARQVVVVPLLPPGTGVGIQGLVLQTPGAPCPSVVTAALYLEFR
jgi:hypothetical protein